MGGRLLRHEVGTSRLDHDVVAPGTGGELDVVDAVARISQLELAQPVLTLAWSALLLGERVGLDTVAAGFAVVGAVALTQRTRHRPVDDGPPPDR